MEGLIRKIIIGNNPKDAMAYFVGMRAGANKVSAILLDEQHLFKFGKKRYLVYIEDTSNTLLWKSIDDMPCIIEYNLDF